MKKPDKASIYYSIGFIVLSIIQMCLIHGLFTTPQENIIQTGELYVDGADFSPLISLFDSGMQSIVFEISVLFNMFLGFILSLIVMLIIRKFARRFSTSETRQFDTIETIIVSVICLLIGCIFSRFQLILDVVLIYIPIPVVSWLAFHLGKKPEQDAA